MKLKFKIEDGSFHNLFIRVDGKFISVSDYFSDRFSVSVYPEEKFLGVHGKDVWYQSDDGDWNRGRLDQDYKIKGVDDKQYTFYTGGGDDFLVGGNVADLLSAGGGHNKILGKAGSDEIEIIAGKNVAKGGAHEDVFEIVGGDSILFGGSGNDRYFFFDASEVTIKDFESGSDDIGIFWASSYKELDIEKHKGGTLIVSHNPEDLEEEIRIFIENLAPRELDRDDFFF